LLIVTSSTAEVEKDYRPCSFDGENTVDVCMWFFFKDCKLRDDPKNPSLIRAYDSVNEVDQLLVIKDETIRDLLLSSYELFQERQKAL